MALPLNEHVAQVYGEILNDLGFRQINYFKDPAHFRSELNVYQNDYMQLRFVQDREEEFVQVSRLGDEAFLDLRYLFDMLRPGLVIESNLVGLRTFPQIKDDLVALFGSEHYKCFYRAYMLYENCRNLLGLKMPDGTDVTDFQVKD
jgi:hypothetical protein